MSAVPTDRRDAGSGDSAMSSTYIRVLIVEVIVIAGLYWLGRHFG